MKIYEIDYKLYNLLFDEHEKNNEYGKLPDYFWNRFIVKNENGKGYFCVDNSTNDWWLEEFKNKTQCLMFLVDNELTAEDVIEKYEKDKTAYKHYRKYLATQEEFCEENNIYHRDYFKFDPKKEYDFIINFGDGPREFSSTIENAIGLSANYECDLLHKNTLIFSPQHFEWEENYRLIEQYLGKNYIRDRIKQRSINSNFGVPYREPEDTHLIHFKDDKNIRI